MKKIKEWLGEHKISFVVISVFLAAFLLLNIAWIGRYDYLLGGYAKITVDEKSGSLSDVVGKTVYSVSEKHYLMFTGNLNVDNYDTKEWLTVWPRLLTRNLYSFAVSYKGEQYAYKIDEDCNLINKDGEYNEEEVRIYELNREKAEAAMEKFKSWTKAAKEGDMNYFDNLRSEIA